MRKAKKSEKLLLEQIADSAQSLAQQQRDLSIGQLIALIRVQLSMSQRALSRRARVPQATVSKIESGRQQPTISTLNRILGALECDLLITAVPRVTLQETKRSQAVNKAKKRIEYLEGTMSLEKQTPDQRLLREMIEEEAKRLLDSSGPELWDEGL